MLVSGHAVGISGESRAEEYVDLRTQLDIENMEANIPTPAGDGESFLPLPLSSHEGSVWMREILI